VPTKAVAFPSKDSTELPAFSWHLDDAELSGSHVTAVSAPPIQVRSPSSASLSVESIKDSTVLSDHHYAESSPNLQRPLSSHASSSATSVMEAEELPQATLESHNRVVFLVGTSYDLLCR
jgi:hypothetical protein